MRFDIIVPTINRVTLDRTIKSIYAQRHSDWRLFVIGDGVMPELKDYDRDRVAVLSTDHTGDSGGSQRNLAISMGDSPWVAYLDDDDIWYPDHLSTITKLHSEHPNANMFKTAAQEMVMTRKSPRHKKTETKLRMVNTTDPLTITIAHSRDLFDKTSGWCSADNHDHVLWKEMLAAGGIAATTDHVTALFSR